MSTCQWPQLLKVSGDSRNKFEVGLNLHNQVFGLKKSSKPWYLMAFLPVMEVGLEPSVALPLESPLLKVLPTQGLGPYQVDNTAPHQQMINAVT